MEYHLGRDIVEVVLREQGEDALVHRTAHSNLVTVHHRVTFLVRETA
jgi:hypothetical protein